MAGAEFAAHREAVFGTRATPHDSRPPAACTGERPAPLPEGTRVPMPAATDHPRRVDSGCERAGAARLFPFGEPLVGWRPVTARERRTGVDWAVEVAALRTGRPAAAER